MLSLAIGGIEPCPLNIHDALIEHPHCEVKVRKNTRFVNQPHSGRGQTENLVKLGFGSQFILEVIAAT